MRTSFAIASLSVALLRVCLGGHFLVAAQAPPALRITLLGTTDLHGHIEPLDDYTNKPAQLGLAKIATLIRRVRSERPNVLLLDSGDTIQGTPMAYYFARKDTVRTNPMILAMNALGYDAAAVGNHEFNFGEDVLWKTKRDAHFPILAANIKQTYKSGPQRFDPYIIKQIAGVRIAIVGFVTPVIGQWEIPANYDGYEFENIVDSARRLIPEVRKRADVVVVLAHSGLGPDPATGASGQPYDLPDENEVLALAEQVPGIDVILFGHTHLELPESIVNGVLLTQAKNFGASLARVDLDLKHAADGHWQIVSKHSAVLTVGEQTPPDPKIVELAAPYERATQAYLDTPVATSTQEMHGTTARFEDEPLVDLIHAVQLQAAKADVSMAGMLFTGSVIPKGQVTVRQIASLYVYENYLYAVEMNGAQLRDALEHAASFFQSWPFPAGEPVRLPTFSVDSAEGVNYTIELRLPSGHRIVGLTFRGKPLADTQKLRVALNNYRYTGGDNYAVYKGLPVVYRSTEEIRDLIIEYLTRTRVVPTTSDHNWRIEPQGAVEALRQTALQEERRRASTADSPNDGSILIFSLAKLPIRFPIWCEMLATPQRNSSRRGEID